jgi:hypothetical protein
MKTKPTQWHDPFVFPYTARVMAALPGHEPVELFRTQQDAKLSTADALYWVSHLDDAWDWWIERMTHTSHLCSDRPFRRAPYTTAAKPDLHLRQLAQPSHTYHYHTATNP